MNMVTLHLMIECSRQLIPNASYTALCQRIDMGSTIRKAMNLSVATTVFGMCCGFLVVIGDLLPDVVNTLDGDDENPLLEDRRFWITIYCVVFIVPLVRMKRMDSLRFTSSLAFLCL